jgi:TatD related DNase
MEPSEPTIFGTTCRHSKNKLFLHFFSSVTSEGFGHVPTFFCIFKFSQNVDRAKPCGLWAPSVVTDVCVLHERRLHPSRSGEGVVRRAFLSPLQLSRCDPEYPTSRRSAVSSGLAGTCASLLSNRRAYIHRATRKGVCAEYVQVHCVQAYGQLLEAVQREGPFPHGLVLHSWAGSKEMVQSLRRYEGVYFSLSGHSLNLQPSKLTGMLQEVGPSPSASGFSAFLCLSQMQSGSPLCAGSAALKVGRNEPLLGG